MFSNNIPLYNIYVQKFIYEKIGFLMSKDH